MEPERADSLDGWVAVRRDVFVDTEACRLGFIVQWNCIESKFAVTCHNRTLQRQRRRPEGSSSADPPVSWARLFSVSEFRHIHQHFTGVADTLGPCFPDLSEFEDRNIWDLLLLNRRSGHDAEERDLDSPCRNLEKYLSTAIDLCGPRIVLDTLFRAEEQDGDEYYENLQEFKKKSMQEEMGRAKGHLRKMLQSHRGADRMVALLIIYQEEDEAYQDLVTVATAFFHYLLQPFRDMRELACLYKMEIQKTLELEDLGPKRIWALEKEAQEWRCKAEEAVASIQDITVTYFTQTSKALAGMLKQMEDDQCRFGAAAWASASPRMDKLRFLLAKESLQHMRATEMCLNRRKHSIRQRLCSLSTRVQSPGTDPRSAPDEAVDQLELQFYETQLELYDTRLEILKNEEQLLVAQVLSVQRQIKELKEEVVYYDVCEDPEELQSLVHTGVHHSADVHHTAAVCQLQRHLQTLETKRGNICARRAIIRNRKDQCVEAHEQKQKAGKQSTTTYSQHHQVQLKREKRKEEEERRKQWVDQEREKTLSRLRSFRTSRQGQYILRTTRSRTPPLEEQPLSIISLDPSEAPPPVRPAPRTKKTPRKAPPPKDVPVQIFSGPPPPAALTCPTAAPPPPPLPPPPPPPPPLPPSEDAPKPLCEKAEPVFPAPNPLRQNIGVGTMDEVLASLQRGQIQLRKAPPPNPVAPAEDLRTHLMRSIRQGVTLRKVVPPGVQTSADNELERSIKAAMMRIKKVSADSDDDDVDASSGDWEG